MCPLIRGKVTAIAYRLDSNFIPPDLFFGDTQFRRLLIAAKQCGIAIQESEQEMLNRLYREVIIYHRDSIVHHLSNGCDYYKK